MTDANLFAGRRAFFTDATGKSPRRRTGSKRPGKASPPSDHLPSNPDAEVVEPEDFCPVRVHIKQAGPHELEILTAAEWAALDEDDKPEQFFRYHPDAYIRIRAELPRL